MNFEYCSCVELALQSKQWQRVEKQQDMLDQLPICLADHSFCFLLGDLNMAHHIKAAVRPILYQTECEGFPYSFGGSLFIVNLSGQCYALTCNHVIGNEGIDYLFVAPGPVPSKGVRPAPIKEVARINNYETELQDIAVVSFSDEVSPEFFGGTAYVIGPETIGTSDTANRLRVFGFLNTRTRIDYENKSITGGYCELEFRNVGGTSSDPCIRQGLATYAGHDFESLDGISGAPVFDETAGRLCGMVVRAGLDSLGGAKIWYIDIYHIIKLVEAVHIRSPRFNQVIYPALRGHPANNIG